MIVHLTQKCIKTTEILNNLLFLGRQCDIETSLHIKKEH